MSTANGHTNKTVNGHTNGKLNGNTVISSDPSVDPNWWRQATVYQIYPRSFADANGDGIGDLKGITQRVPYLAKLGIDAVWLSPFYPSALKDGGYDVANYRNVDPRIGTLEDFDEMTAALKNVGIKIFVDIVPNHCSDEHVWFQEALRSPKGSNARARFHFRDGRGPNGDEPPTDWVGEFGGPTWERVADGQWYLHIFDTSQPDLNWDHRDVHEDFLKTLRFWADRGVSGFRVDVAHGLAKDLKDPLPMQAEMDKVWAVLRLDGNPKNISILWDRTEVHDIYKEWRQVFHEYNPPLVAVAEAWVAPENKKLYATSEGLGQSFSFDLLVSEWDEERLKKTIVNSLADAKEANSSTTWVLSNHDVVRHATRLGLERPKEFWGAPNFDPFYRSWVTKPTPVDVEGGLRRAKAATLLMMSLPGSAYIYQGEELGLPEVTDIPDADRQDPMFFHTKGAVVGRDGCRVPIPWTASGSSFGFGPEGSKAHLPQPEWFGKYAVETEDSDPKSTLNLYRKALALRRQLQGPEELEWVEDVGEEGVLHFKRPGGWEVVLNLKGKGIQIPKGEVVLSSAPLEGNEIPIDTTVWVKSA